MKIRKGPFGQFACEELDKDDQLFDYALGVIDCNAEDIFLPLSVNKTYDGNELAFDHSGLVSINDHSGINNKNRDQYLKIRRKAIGSFFLSVAHCPDILINPSLIVLDPRFVFTDDNGTFLKVCLMPLKTNKPLRLSSMDPKALEGLLDHDFFRDALSDEEINTIIYSASSNNRKMLTEVTDRLMSDDHNNEQHAPDIKLIYSSALALLALLSFFIIDIKMAVVSAVASALFLYAVSHRSHNDTGTPPSDTDKLVLFDDLSQDRFCSAFLESLAPVNGDIIRYAVYQDCTTIGSDRFLSDLYINDRSLSPIHAQIYMTQDTVYLSDCSAEGKTFIDDKPVSAETKHEVKNGQKITLGNVDLKITISRCQLSSLQGGSSDCQNLQVL
ncbi:MAG: FHA domain-containing protein [Clostridiales bacterium]|nr:FHA domain-containing protein [Clostridiales bacterium]